MAQPNIARAFYLSARHLNYAAAELRQAGHALRNMPREPLAERYPELARAEAERSAKLAILFPPPRQGPVELYDDEMRLVMALPAPSAVERRLDDLEERIRRLEAERDEKDR